MKRYININRCWWKYPSILSNGITFGTTVGDDFYFALPTITLLGEHFLKYYFYITLQEFIWHRASVICFLFYTFEFDLLSVGSHHLTLLGPPNPRFSFVKYGRNSRLRWNLLQRIYWPIPISIHHARVPNVGR